MTGLSQTFFIICALFLSAAVAEDTFEEHYLQDFRGRLAGAEWSPLQPKGQDQYIISKIAVVAIPTSDGKMSTVGRSLILCGDQPDTKLLIFPQHLISRDSNGLEASDELRVILPRSGKGAVYDMSHLSADDRKSIPIEDDAIGIRITGLPTSECWPREMTNKRSQPAPPNAPLRAYFTGFHRGKAVERKFSVTRTDPYPFYSSLWMVDIDANPGLSGVPFFRRLPSGDLEFTAILVGVHQEQFCKRYSVSECTNVVRTISTEDLHVIDLPDPPAIHQLPDNAIVSIGENSRPSRLSRTSVQ